MVSVLEQRVVDAVGPSDFNVYDGYLTKSQLAKAMGRNQRTLDNWHRYHIGPPRIKFGAVILYNIEAFKQHLFDDPLRAATDRVGAIVAAAGEDKPAATVVRLKK